VPEHIRALSSPAVLAVEADVVTRLAARADTPSSAASTAVVVTAGLASIHRSGGSAVGRADLRG